MSLLFDFPASLTTEKFISELGNKADKEPDSKKCPLNTYYASFSLQLYTNGTGKVSVFSQQYQSEEIGNVLLGPYWKCVHYYQ